LNRLNPKTYQYPDLEGCAPLLSHIKYDTRFEKALSQVFGKTCICDNLEIGQRIAREYEFSAITIEGKLPLFDSDESFTFLRGSGGKKGCNYWWLR
jgi:chromosome segregation ATPase